MSLIIRNCFKNRIVSILFNKNNLKISCTIIFYKIENFINFLNTKVDFFDSKLFAKKIFLSMFDFIHILYIS